MTSGDSAADRDHVSTRAKSEFAVGGGAVVRGHAQDLLMVVCGRRMPHGRLSGPTADRLTIG